MTVVKPSVPRILKIWRAGSRIKNVLGLGICETATGNYYSSFFSQLSTPDQQLLPLISKQSLASIIRVLLISRTVKSGSILHLFLKVSDFHWKRSVLIVNRRLLLILLLYGVTNQIRQKMVGHLKWVFFPLHHCCIQQYGFISWHRIAHTKWFHKPEEET